MKEVQAELESSVVEKDAFIHRLKDLIRVRVRVRVEKDAFIHRLKNPFFILPILFLVKIKD